MQECTLNQILDAEYYMLERKSSIEYRATSIEQPASKYLLHKSNYPRLA